MTERTYKESFKVAADQLLAAVGALAAVLTDCSLEVERAVTADTTGDKTNVA